MSNETHDTSLNIRQPIVCPGCGAEHPLPESAYTAPLVGYHHCRSCGLVWREYPSQGINQPSSGVR